ncbi:MAG: phosphopyruvate hydratase [Proteobacteria bacterium]|nr:phosphopyruvate hydratase [Pseudomonadota bacterium]
MSKFTIKDIRARQVFDSRANPTVEVDVFLEGGGFGRGTVPSGASKGIYEALELRDGDSANLGGRSVRKAIENVQKIIAPALIGKDASNQAGLDRLMIDLDGSENKSVLGANAILACSMAIARAAADAMGMPLFRYLGGAHARTIPVPMIQIIGGGAHAVNTIDVQDFLIIPLQAPTFEEGYAQVVDVYEATKRVFESHGKPLATADEGGFWPTDFATNEEGLELLTEGIKLAGFTPGKEIGIALDIASSEFYDEKRGVYTFHLENKEFSREQFVDLLVSWVDKYAIISIEDGCSELDWEGSIMLTERLGNRIQLIGDDLFTTRIDRIAKGVAENACNSVLIKMNQIGTITETLEAIEYTKNCGYLPVVSARSGETEDDTIVHLAVASNAGQLKVGSVARTERTVKWNECIRVEEYLGREGIYPAGTIFSRIK